MNMTITVNGQKKEVPEGTTVQGLLERLNIQQQRVAVERNEEIVKKTLYAETVIGEGDSLEVVSFMGGGSAAGPRSEMPCREVRNPWRRSRS